MTQFSKKSQEGYLMIDHRASPGIPEDVARASGFDPDQCREGKLFEAASLTCAHCKNSVVKNPLRTRDRPHCMKCNHYICDLCGFKAAQSDYVHAPFEKIASDVMRSNDALRSMLGSPPSLLMP